MSTHIQFEDSLKTISLIPPSSSSLHCPSNKRYSADYTNIKRSATQRQHSESFNGLGKRRPSSADLLSTVTAASVSNNRISRMSLQFRSNQMNAVRMAVDHKLRDVSTQDYLSLRAWNMRERDQIAYYQKKSTTPTQPDEVHNDTTNMSSKSVIYNNSSRNNNSSSIDNGQPGSGNSRKLSASFLRSSASSLSLMIPKRTTAVKTRHSDSATFCSNPLDHITGPSTNHSSYLNNKKSTVIADVSSSTLFEAAVISTETEEYKEIKNQYLHPLQLPSLQPSVSSPSTSPPPQARQEKLLERKKSSGMIMANKVLQRMKSFRYNSKKAASAKTATNCSEGNEDSEYYTSNNSNSNAIIPIIKVIIFN
jgi:hypothetical protein